MPEPGAGAGAGEPRRPFALLGTRSCAVIANSESGTYRLIKILDEAGPRPTPGQFYMLTCVEGWGGKHGRPYLPRAFSFAQATQSATGLELTFLADDVGPGTARLVGLAPGDELSIMGPLGAGFSDPRSLNKSGAGVILVGGGIGVAPLAALRASLRESGTAISTLLGYLGTARHGGLELFSSAGSLCSGVRLASEDGSLGHQGYVTDLLAMMLAGDDVQSAAVYACGPPAMLEAVRIQCAELGVEAELALEAPMACGYGACMGCAIPLPDGGFMRLCIDGPVVRAADIETALVAGSGH